MQGVNAIVPGVQGEEQAEEDDEDEEKVIIVGGYRIEIGLHTTRGVKIGSF